MCSLWKSWCFIIPGKAQYFLVSLSKFKLLDFLEYIHLTHLCSFLSSSRIVQRYIYIINRLFYAKIIYTCLDKNDCYFCKRIKVFFLEKKPFELNIFCNLRHCLFLSQMFKEFSTIFCYLINAASLNADLYVRHD